jgi:Cu/Ag efflux pump CusA
MIAGLIALAVRNRTLVGLITALAIGLGIWGVRVIRLDAMASAATTP